MLSNRVKGSPTQYPRFDEKTDRLEYLWGCPSSPLFGI